MNIIVGRGSTMKKRNGKIELFRFIFCCLIICFHINVDYWNGGKNLTEHISFCGQGRIGVEFFFVVSGFLLAASVYKSLKTKEDLGKDTACFIYKKWLGIFPCHIVAYFITFAVAVICRNLGVFAAIKVFINSLPNLFLIQKTGIYSQNLIGVEWYISTMLLAMIVLYPLCKKYYTKFVRIVAPLIAVFLVGYMCHETGGLSLTSDWAGICAKVQLRAVAELCLGIFGFEVTRFLKRLNISGMTKAILTIVEWMCYIFAILFAISTLGREYEPYALYALFVAVVLSFSNQTLTCEILNIKIVYFLGKISLPMYLMQNAIRELIQYYLQNWSITTQIVITLIGIFLVSIIVLILGNNIKKMIVNMEVKLRGEIE